MQNQKFLTVFSPAQDDKRSLLNSFALYLLRVCALFAVRRRARCYSSALFFLSFFLSTQCGFEDEMVFALRKNGVRAAEGYSVKARTRYISSVLGASSWVTTSNLRRVASPKDVVMATSAASRPTAMSTRPTCGVL